VNNGRGGGLISTATLPKCKWPKYQQRWVPARDRRAGDRLASAEFCAKKSLSTFSGPVHGLENITCSSVLVPSTALSAALKTRAEPRS
jgi:hypothetical protein